MWKEKKTIETSMDDVDEEQMRKVGGGGGGISSREQIPGAWPNLGYPERE